MSDHLNKKEIDQLMDLFNKIKLDLSDSSFPARSTVKGLGRYLQSIRQILVRSHHSEIMGA